MKELLLSAIILANTFAFSQKSNQEKCGFDYVHQKMMLEDPSYRQKTEDFNNQLLENSQKRPTMAPPYRVPTVVHVMHRGEAVGVGSNISDDDIKSGIRYLNERLRKTAGGVGDGAGVDTQIEYALAVRDPSGNCTDGIVRVDMSGNASFMNCGVDAGGGCGLTDAVLMPISRWNPNDYYNVYLVYEIDNNNCGAGIQGFAYFASAHGGTQDGAVMLSCTFGGSTGTTFTHELGHSLDLYHTFEGDGGGGFCPTNTNCNTQGDRCCDIPPHGRSSSDCVTYSNTCDGGTTSELFIHNYLDYSSDACQSEFTADQTTRMQAALTGTRASFLESNGNMSLVPPSAPSADFVADAAFVCSGTSVKFLDYSSCIPNTYENGAWTDISFNWTFDDGVNPVINSTLQNPELTLPAGSYDVTLQVTNPSGTNTVTKNNFIVVGSTPAAACIPTCPNEDNYVQTISNVTFNTINNSTSTFRNVAYTDYTCSNNTVVTAGNTYNLSIDFNAGGSAGEVFEVYIDYNSNNTFEAGELVHSGSTAANTSNSSNVNVTIPTTAVKNTLLRMRLIGEAGSISAAERSCSSAYFISDVEDYGIYISSNTGLSVDLLAFNAIKEKTYSKLNWETNSGNGLSHFVIERSTDAKDYYKIGEVKYINHIENNNVFNYLDKKPKTGKNYYRLKMVNKDNSFKYSDVKIVDFESKKLSIFPNPFNDILTVRGIQNSENAKVQVYSLLGELVFDYELNAENNTINTQLLSSGTYIISIQTENNTFVEKLIKTIK